MLTPRPEQHAAQGFVSRDRDRACVVVHGDVNALSIVRSLGRLGITVHALNDAGSPVLSSRYATPITVDCGERERQDAWADFLLGPAGEALGGSVLLACSDAALRMIAARREDLARRFVLDLSDPQAQLAMLDKQASLEIARSAGIGHPRFWTLAPGDTVEDLEDDITYPVLVKPLDTHHFQELTGHKLLIAHTREDLGRAMSAAARAGVEFVLVEVIPGRDDQLCSYYTYLDEHGEPQFHFTKRVFRRFPCFEGPACYHMTAWVPDAAESGLRFLQHAGVRGLGHVEFKRDPRDGTLKFIECNARFTAANNLVGAAGFDLGVFVYDRLTSGDRLTSCQEPPGEFRRGLHLWHPVRDFRAMLELRSSGEITVGRWARSLLHPQVLPYFAGDDPGPSLRVARNGVEALLTRARPRR